jgi:hypothetical protein
MADQTWEHVLDVLEIATVSRAMIHDTSNDK